MRKIFSCHLSAITVEHQCYFNYIEKNGLGYSADCQIIQVFWVMNLNSSIVKPSRTEHASNNLYNELQRSKWMNKHIWKWINVRVYHLGYCWTQLDYRITTLELMHKIFFWIGNSSLQVVGIFITIEISIHVHCFRWCRGYWYFWNF